jgi:group I intron endonuclease
MKQAYIYKMTSPSNKIYIGQTRNLIKRKSYYRTLNRNTQPAIYNSLQKYGFENHNFEIIETLPEDSSQDLLNEREIYYINYYKNNGYIMLNIKEGGSSGKLPEESIEKIRLANTGRKHSEETKRKHSENAKRLGLKPPSNKGKHMSEKTKQKMSESAMGIVKAKGLKNAKSRCVAQLLNDKIVYVFETITEAINLTGIPKNTIIRTIKNSDNHYGGGYKWKYISKEEFLLLKLKNQDIYKRIELIQEKKIIAIYNNGDEIIFKSISEAAKQLDVFSSNIIKVLRGERKTTNNINFKYL